MPPKASKGAAKQSKLTTTGSFLPTLQKPNSVIGEVGPLWAMREQFRRTPLVRSRGLWLCHRVGSYFAHAPPP